MKTKHIKGLSCLECKLFFTYFTGLIFCKWNPLKCFGIVIFAFFTLLPAKIS